MDREERLEQKLDILADSLSDIKSALAEHHAILKSHVEQDAKELTSLKAKLDPVVEKTASHATLLNLVSVGFVALVGKVIKDLLH